MHAVWRAFVDRLNRHSVLERFVELLKPTLDPVGCKMVDVKLQPLHLGWVDVMKSDRIVTHALDTLQKNECMSKIS